MKRQDFIKNIGNTPLIYIESLSKLTGAEVYGKAEFMNPGGSVKDRAALGMIEDAEKKGLLKPGGLIVEATAGNTGIGLALIGNMRGYKVKLLVPSTQSQEKIDTLRGVGAEVLVVPPAPYPDPKNYRMIAADIAKAEGGYYINQFENESNYKAHYHTTGPEIWEQTEGQITGFTCAIGSGGTLAGVSTYLKEKNSNVRIGCVDPVGSSMYQYFKKGQAEVTPGESISEGIGQTFVTANVKPAKVDQCHLLEDQTIVDMVHFMVKEEGLFLGSSSGANLCGAYLLAKKLGKGAKVVTILCDNGQKYVSKIYNPEFLKAKSLSIHSSAESWKSTLDKL